jgi:hypothetical protein
LPPLTISRSELSAPVPQSFEEILDWHVERLC